MSLAVARLDDSPDGQPSGVRAVQKNLEANLRFGFLIHDVSRLRRIVVDRALKPLGLTRSQWWVLAFLSRRDGMTQTALAADLDLTKVAVGGLVDRMEGAGFVERRADERDARARRIFLTRSGLRLVNKIRESVDVVEADILSTVTEAELDQAAAVLLKLKSRLLEMVDQNGDTTNENGP
ncbi:MarR family winged helix-turn-helix transcriptional regulator [Tsuneonella sp. HG094]